MSMSLVELLTFFNFELPCPGIPGCDALRIQYAAERENLKNTPGCMGCKMRALDNKWREHLNLVTKTSEPIPPIS